MKQDTLDSTALPWACADARPKMNATDVAVLTVLEGEAIGGLASASHRWIAEQVGRSRTTVGNSLRRLRTQGLLTAVGTPRPTSISRFRINNLSNNVTNIPSARTYSKGGVREIFRSRDLYGAGVLYENAPKEKPLYLTEVCDVAPGRTRSTASRQLQRLESLPIPLVISAQDPTHVQRLLWTFRTLNEVEELEILERLSEMEAPYAPKPRKELELQHFWERMQSNEVLSLETYPSLYESKVAPNSMRDPQTGCLVFMGPRNANGYGTPTPNRPGIGAHRIAWVVHRGPVPPGYEIHHMCGTRSCIDPAHLDAVPVAEHRLITQKRSKTESVTP